MPGASERLKRLFSEPLGPRYCWAIGLASLAVVAVVDYMVGPQFILAVLYLMPILFVAWFLGLKSGLLVAGISWGLALHNAGVFTSELAYAPLVVALRLATALTFFLLTAWLAANLHAKQEQLQRLIDEDPVTGAATWRRFHALTEGESYRLARYGHSFTIVYLDIDNFKKVNDTLGHAEGDALLRTVATAIRDTIRTSDNVARLGGDEFAILLPETSAEVAHPIMEKINARLAQRMEQGKWPVTFSMGVLTCLKETSVDTALQEADSLMYQAKRSGKNAIRYGVK